MIQCTFENGHNGSLRHVVVDVIVVRDEKILLVKRAARLLEGGKWGVPGGFLARDETIQEGASREALEETGWQLDNLKLLRIVDQPDRPREDRQNVSFVFIAEATQKTGDGDDESERQEWFTWSELPAREVLAFDHAVTLPIY